MTRSGFANMLDYYAAQHGHDFQWALKRFHRLYGTRAKWPAEVVPLEPTVLFIMLLRSLEADIANQPRAIPRGGTDPWATKLAAW